MQAQQDDYNYQDPTNIIIHKIIGANREIESSTEVQILISHLDHQITMVEANKITPNFKAIIKVMITI